MAFEKSRLLQLELDGRLELRVGKPKFLDLESLDFFLFWPCGLLSLLLLRCYFSPLIDFPKSPCSKPQSSLTGSLQFISAPIQTKIPI